MKSIKRIFVVITVLVAVAMLAVPIHSQTNAEPIACIEHIGLNVANVTETVEWYSANLDMKIARKTGDPSNAHFLVDAAGKNMIEFYSNTAAPVPDYAKMDPLMLHIAFKVNDVAAARARLIAAGAAPEGEITTTPLGDTLAMLRSPQGIAIQLAKRAKPMVK